MYDLLSSSIRHIRAGRLRPLAVTTGAALEVLPDIPPIGEFVPGYEASSKEVNAALHDRTGYLPGERMDY